VDILSPGEIRMKAGADFEQARHSTGDHGRATGRLRDAAQDLQEGRFSGAVRADNPDGLAAIDLERHVLERPNRVVSVLLLRKAGQVAKVAQIGERPAREIGKRRPQRIVAFLFRADAIALREPVDVDGSVRHDHATSAKTGSFRTKYTTPKANIVVALAEAMVIRSHGSGVPTTHARNPSMTPT